MLISFFNNLFYFVNTFIKSFFKHFCDVPKLSFAAIFITVFKFQAFQSMYTNVKFKDTVVVVISYSPPLPKIVSFFYRMQKGYNIWPFFK
jgi:hypothetical protein